MNLNQGFFIKGACALLFISESYAGAVAVQNNPIKNIQSSPWNVVLGTRYWLSSGESKTTLSTVEGQKLSSSIFSNLNANTAEGYWRLKHQEGLLFKGYLGGGSIGSGLLNNKAFPPGTVPYSQTQSQQKNGGLSYLNLDLGYDLFSNETLQLAGFIGYQHWAEQYNAFGCTQTGDNPAYCGTDYAPYSTSAAILSTDSGLNSLRLGANAALALRNNLNLNLDLAYIRSNLSARSDNHTDANVTGLPSELKGNGFELDAIIDWALNSDTTLGIGARWWHVVTDGYTHYEQTFSSGKAYPVSGVQDRYGLTLEGGFKFDSAQAADSKDGIQTSWSGLYFGPNLAYGAQSQNVSITASSIVSESYLVPTVLNVANLGFSGGAQIGYNWIRNLLVMGLEADLNFSGISGATGATSSANYLTTSASERIHWMSTLRARLGKLATQRTLVYLTAGPAFGKTSVNYYQTNLGYSCSQGLCSTADAKATKGGWTAGAGIEYAATQSISFKAEYLYLSLGTLSLSANGVSLYGNPSYNIEAPFNSNLFRLGVNYKI